MPSKLLTAGAAIALTVATNFTVLAPVSLAQSIQTKGYAFIPSSELNSWTDSFFWWIYPEMQNRTIQPHQHQYRKEWLAIREALKNKFVWSQLHCVDESYRYLPRDYGEAVNAATDAVFHARHPELGGRQIQPYESELIREWESISENFPLSLC